MPTRTPTRDHKSIRDYECGYEREIERWHRAGEDRDRGTENTEKANKVNKMVGAGSQHALLNVDKNGEYMDGAKTCKLNIPADVPAKDFWSIVAYDPQTRSQLQTSQPFPLMVKKLRRTP